MKMALKQFRIGQLAKELHVERFVIRFWEKEFNIKSVRSEGGQRFYTDKDLAKFKAIKKLLYEEGFTIAGAKKYLHEQDHRKIGAQKTTMDTQHKKPSLDPFVEQLLILQKQLIKLRSLL